MQGIDATGDGSRFRPYQVSRVEDEYDFLRGKELVMLRQGILHDGERSLDEIECIGDVKVYFDVSFLARHVRPGAVERYLERKPAQTSPSPRK